MRSILLLLISLVSITTAATAPDTLTAAQVTSTTMGIVQLLGVPAVYSVADCQVRLMDKDKNVVLMFY